MESSPITSPVERISGPEHGVDGAALAGAEALEGEHRLLHRDRGIVGQIRAVALGGQHAAAAQIRDRGAGHEQGCGLRQRDAGGLGDEGHGAGGTRVGLEHVEHPVGEGELDVEQSAHAHALGDRQGRGADAVHDRVAEGDRREGTGRVAGVDAGFLDVLHHAADVEVGAVVEGVDVDLDGGVEKAVDEDRGLGPSPSGRLRAT